MQNELKTFLEEENHLLFEVAAYNTWSELEHWVENHDQRLIQRLVEIMKKEAWKLPDASCDACSSPERPTPRVYLMELEDLLANLTI